MMQDNQELFDEIARTYKRVEPEYVCRFVPQSDAAELIDLYHLARVPLSGTPDYNSRYARMVQAAKWYAKEHPPATVMGAYKDLNGLLG
jgi:hypothetical protein